MAWQISQRFGFPTPNSDDTPLAPLRANLELLVGGLEASAAKYGHGVIGIRPVASASTFGMVWTTPTGSAAWCDGVIWRSLLGSFVDARDYMTSTPTIGSTSGATFGQARNMFFNVATTPAEFQAAVDAARLAKLPLYLPAGEYWLGVNTTINVHNVTMFGDGWDRTIIYYNNQTIIPFTPNPGNPTSPKVPDQIMFTTAHPGGGTYNAPSDFRMSDLSIRGLYSRSMLDVAHNGTCLVERVRFFGNVAGALYLTNGVPNALINVTPRISNDLLETRTAWVFRGCIFQNDHNTAGTPGSAAIRIADVPAFTYGNNGHPLIIENCVFQTDAGIIGTGNNFKNVTARGCSFSGSSSINWQTQMPLLLDACRVDKGDIYIEYTDIAYVAATDSTFTNGTQPCFRWNGTNGVTGPSPVVQGSLRFDRCVFLQDAASSPPVIYEVPITAGRIVALTTSACTSPRDPTVTSYAMGASATTAFLDLSAMSTGYTLLYQKHSNFMKLDPSTRIPTAIINV